MTGAGMDYAVWGPLCGYKVFISREWTYYAGASVFILLRLSDLDIRCLKITKDLLKTLVSVIAFAAISMSFKWSFSAYGFYDFFKIAGMEAKP